jgi:hypothetical protein
MMVLLLSTSQGNEYCRFKEITSKNKLLSYLDTGFQENTGMIDQYGPLMDNLLLG